MELSCVSPLESVVDGSILYSHAPDFTPLSASQPKKNKNNMIYMDKKTTACMEKLFNISYSLLANLKGLKSIFVWKSNSVFVWKSCSILKLKGI